MHCADGLRHVTVYLELSTEDLGPCCNNEPQGSEEELTNIMFSASTVCLTKPLHILAMLVLKVGLGGLLKLL